MPPTSTSPAPPFPASFFLNVLLAASGCKKNGADDPDLPVDNTPAQHSDISPKPAKGCGNYSWHYSSAYKTLREVEEYKPELREYYVRELNDHRNEFLLAGISPSFRKDWFESHKTAEKDIPCMMPLFEEIGAAAKRTLPKFRPRGYTHHDSSEEKLMVQALKQEVPDAEVLGVGTNIANWEIEKLGNGTPSNRYKYGMVWVKSPSFDDGYCRIAYVNVFQDYSGGGTYADTQANFIKMEPAGCR